MIQNKCLLSSQQLVSVLRWADYCRRDKNFQWTAWDANLTRVVQHEIKRQRHLIYLKRKNKVVIPYHLT